MLLISDVTTFEKLSHLKFILPAAPLSLLAAPEGFNHNRPNNIIRHAVISMNDAIPGIDDFSDARNFDIRL